MNRFENLSCPVCGQTFQPQDDIVVCPVCGTPHHRECYQKLGHCAHLDWHAQGKRFEAGGRSDQTREKQQDTQSGEEKKEEICPRCGAVNPPDLYFCRQCGFPLNGPFQKEQNRSWQNNGQQPPYSGADPRYQQPPFGGVPPVFFSPYAGMDPEEELAEGVTVKEMAQYLGTASPSFLMRFRRIAKERKTVSWNLLFAVGNVFYALYRKFYRIALPLLIYGILYIGLNLAITIFTYQALFSQLSNTVSVTEIYSVLEQVMSQLPSGVLLLYDLLHFLLLPICILMGLFGDKLYFHYCVDRIREIKASHQTSEEELQVQLARKGGVNKTALLISLVVMFIVMFVLPTAIAAFMMTPSFL